MKKNEKNTNIADFDAISYIRKERKSLTKKFNKMTNEEIIKYLKENSLINTIRPSV